MLNIIEPNSWLIIDDLVESIEEWSQKMLHTFIYTDERCYSSCKNWKETEKRKERVEIEREKALCEKPNASQQLVMVWSHLEKKNSLIVSL